MIIHQKFDHKQGAKCSEQHLKKNLSYSNVSRKEQMLSHANSKQSHECHSATEKAPCFVEHTNEVDISISAIAHTVRMFRHGDMHLLPQVHRIAQHRDRTRRGNLAFLLQLVFWIRSCVFSFGMHISSWSRTRDTTLILD